MPAHGSANNGFPFSLCRKRTRCDEPLVSWSASLLGLSAGALISVLTTPVGVSGAVFLLPVQLSLLGVPSPAVTPTNLLFNVIAAPGALLRYRASGHLGGRLTRLLLVGTLPGVVIGAAIRVYAAPGPREFRLIVAAVLLPLGLWLCTHAAPGSTAAARPDRAQYGAVLAEPTVAGLALMVGIIGGIYGIGGGSILGPILVGRGMPVATVAPAALASTFVTSAGGAATYGLLSLVATGDIAPVWSVGLACGLGGLIGGYLGARLQPRLPEPRLRLLLGVLATALALLYLLQAAR
jgi:uncharacterized membrane protein YfcA